MQKEYGLAYKQQRNITASNIQKAVKDYGKIP